MPLPKRKRSKMKQGTKRAHKKLTPPEFSPCPQCQEPKLPHRVCLDCGYYDGQEVIKVGEA
ncbi:MAG: 50S ribosomal protein L32 [Candidatus Schekmanbacteria bacterium]|nr:50S ribosomal protein L32 [Candidatus Schekmanbacteria bacterium]